MSIRSRFIQLLVIWPDPTHWPTHPPTHPHPPMAGSVSTNHKIFKQNWIILIQSTIFKFLVIWPDPTHQPTQPPTKSHTHPWVGNSSQIFKSSNGNKFKYLDKLKCDRILSDSGGPPPWGGGGWVDGGDGGHGCVGECPMHTHMHTHACTCMLNMLNMLNMDASMSAAICNFYTCINVHVCVCMHVHVCVGGTPLMPPDAPHPPAPSPGPQGARNTKIQ